MSGDERAPVPLLLGAGTLWAFGGTVVANSAAAFTMGRAFPGVAATALGVAMLLFAAAHKSVHPSRIVRYFLVQATLATGILLVGEGRGVLVVMPLLSQLTLVASRRTVVAFGAVCAAVFVVACGPHARTLALVLGQLVGFSTAALFTVVFTEVALRERDARKETERLANELGRAQSRLAELAVAEERVRLAGEIHDGLGHALTAARMQIEGAAAVLDHDPARAREALEKASRLVREGLVDVRQSVRALRPDANDGPLEERLRRLLRESAYGIATELDVRGIPRPLLAAEEHVLYRVAQEAITNVGRHAAATKVSVVLDFCDDETSLAIDDDGRGMGEAVFGVGLTGMAERLARLRGSLEIRRSEAGGVGVRATLPPRERPAALE